MEWKEALRTKVLISDFHIEYKVFKLIGTGSFARVIPIIKNPSFLTFNPHRSIMEKENALVRNSPSRPSARRISARRAKELYYNFFKTLAITYTQK